MAKNEAKIKFTAETSDFNQQIKNSNDKMSELRAELKLNEAQMKTTGTTTEGLKTRQGILENQLKTSADKVSALSNKLEAAERNFGENSHEASRLRTELLSAQSAEERIKGSINECSQKLDDQAKGFKDSSDAAQNSSGGFTVMKGAIADLVSNGIQWCIGKVGELVGSLMSLPEETAELRQDLATLNTSFDNSGFSAEQAEGTWKDLYAVFGEDDRAVEAANNISHMAKSQEELNAWTTITTGVWGTYQDALPVESLAEAANETAKCGTVTGTLADALNWSSEAATMFAGYMGGDVKTAEDAFNVALSECSTEQERQALITETLNTLYGDAAGKYRDTASAQMEAKNASAEQKLAEAELAEAVQPVTTELTTLKTEVLQGVTPAIQGLTGAAMSAIGWMKEHPTLMKVIITVVGILTTSLTALAVATGIQTAAQWAMNSAILANPITWIAVGIVAAITSIIAIGVALYKNWDKIKEKASTLWNGLKTTFGKIKTAITSPIEEAKTAVGKAVDKIKGFFSGLTLKLPHIKLPHFSLSGKFSLAPPKVPKLSVSWYKEGGIMTRPTIFAGVGNHLLGGGEAGPEAILPLSKLEGFISRAMQRENVADSEALVNAIERLADRDINLYISDKQIATAIASESDKISGTRSSLKSRGLILE